MLKTIRDSKISALTKKEHLLKIALGFSLVGNMFLAITVHQTIGSERIVLVPPAITEDTWISSTQASVSYLKEMSQYLLATALNVTPESAKARKEQFLKYVNPKGYGDIKDQLIEEELVIQKKNMSKMFNPMSFEIDEQAMTVKVTGEMTTWIAREPISQERATFLMSYVMSNGRLLLVDFKEEKNEKKF